VPPRAWGWLTERWGRRAPCAAGFSPGSTCTEDLGARAGARSRAGRARRGVPCDWFETVCPGVPMSEDHGGAHGGTWSAPPHLCPSTGRNNAQLFTAAAERVTRLYKSPDRNHFCMAANAVTALYREQEAEVVRAQHRG